MGSKKKTFLIALAVFLAVCCLGSIIIALLNPESGQGSSSIVQSPSPKVGLPSPTVFITPTSTITLPAPTAVYKPGIPELSPVDVKFNLEERSFTCSDAKFVEDKQTGSSWYFRTCSRDITDVGIYLLVEFVGAKLTTVDWIDATITQVEPSQEVAASYLGFIATLAFIGNAEKQEVAKQWVIDNIANSESKPETTIDGIRFRLYGPPTGITLEFGDID